MATREKIVIDLSPGIPALPRLEDKTKIDVRYMLISPYVSAHIFFDKKNMELMYVKSYTKEKYIVWNLKRIILC